MHFFIGESSRYACLSVIATSQAGQRSSRAPLNSLFIIATPKRDYIAINRSSQEEIFVSQRKGRRTHTCAARSSIILLEYNLMTESIACAVTAKTGCSCCKSCVRHRKWCTNAALSLSLSLSLPRSSVASFRMRENIQTNPILTRTRKKAILAD